MFSLVVMVFGHTLTFDVMLSRVTNSNHSLQSGVNGNIILLITLYEPYQEKQTITTPLVFLITKTRPCNIQRFFFYL